MNNFVGKGTRYHGDRGKEKEETRISSAEQKKKEPVNDVKQSRRVFLKNKQLSYCGTQSEGALKDITPPCLQDTMPGSCDGASH
ncbi:hypothetical protein CEXT_525511 [Caerostris extrusa]|uniref:Uncharacterized protein n=1 Tax=Caerostris extrusa TaxID=172846 RepID=A0AAV4Y2S3_CAEEX|nr:hypothetical protein CEXT_525511 [Caerostris extrusa]